MRSRGMLVQKVHNAAKHSLPGPGELLRLLRSRRLWLRRSPPSPSNHLPAPRTFRSPTHFHRLDWSIGQQRGAICCLPQWQRPWCSPAASCWCSNGIRWRCSRSRRRPGSGARGWVRCPLPAARLWGLCCTRICVTSSCPDLLAPSTGLVQAERQPAARGGAPQQRRPGGARRGGQQQRIHRGSELPH